MKRIPLIFLWLLCQVCNLIAALQMLAAILIGSPRAWTLAVSYDQLGNVILGGSEDMTISARAWAQRHTWRWAWLVWFLNLIEKNHCYKAWVSERQRAQALAEQQEGCDV
ncbi:MAG: hypothetical protein ACYC0O_09185 [Desulfurivibrionaceae bacterium]